MSACSLCECEASLKYIFHQFLHVTPLQALTADALGFHEHYTSYTPVRKYMQDRMQLADLSV